jgi:lipoprotein NlpD
LGDVVIDRQSGLRSALQVGGLVAVLVLTGCAATKQRAPVEDRTTSSSSTAASRASSAAAAAAEAPKVLPGAENAGKPGYYTVKPGDTVIRIGLESGQNWRDIVKWNALENQNLIEVGQVLRVVQPGVDPTQAGVRPVVPPRVETRPLEPRSPTAAAAGSPASVVPSTAASASASAASSAAATAAAKDNDSDINWAWPSGGTVVAGFDDARSNKGLSIGGKAGDPVLASAEGRVVYAGSGLRGYGNLIILQHNGGYLTAYAHNQTLLVKEDQAVRRGQKIAEMGATDSDRVQLHFEIRKQGKPVDPARLLPPR